MMKSLRFIILTFMTSLIITVSCQGVSNNIAPNSLSDTEKEVYDVLKDVEKNWQEKNFDGVFEHYADDGIFTGKKNAPASKKDLKKHCVDTSKYWKINQMIIKELSVNQEEATAVTVLQIESNGKVRDHKENYDLEKRNGTWLIIKETNP